MEALSGTRSEFDFGGVGAGVLEDVDGAELIEIAAAVGAKLVFELPGREIEIVRLDERADAGALAV